MMYSHDGFGLGHFKRNLTIATRFVETVPGSNVLMLVGCPISVGGHLPQGVDYVKLPSIIKVGTGEWRSRNLRDCEQQTKSLRAAIIRNAVQAFKPAIFLADHMPTGVWGELVPTLEMLKYSHWTSTVVLGLRDILDAPDINHNLWVDQGAYDAIGRYYDGIFVYGDQRIFDTVASYDLDRRCPTSVRYCGYVCSDKLCRSGIEIRHALQIVREKLVVVTAGGGYDAFPMMASCMETFHALGESSTIEAIFIAGPLMPAEQQDALRCAAEGLPVRVLTSVEESLSYLNAADLVITMAGYNTLIEAVSLDKNVLVFPRDGPSAEQRMRAKVFSDAGLIRALDPKSASPSTLAALIRETLDGRKTSTALRPKMNGAAVAVRRMIDMLDSDAFRLPQLPGQAPEFAAVRRPAR